MDNIDALLDLQFSKDHKAAYAALGELLAESAASDAVYRRFGRLVELLRHPGSYCRTRGLLLIAANACRDGDGKIDGILPDYLACVRDPKPITARQCIRSLPAIARARPHLAGAIREALGKADPGRYPETMARLIARDIGEALGEIGQNA